MGKILKHMGILILSLLLATIILVIPQLNNRELMDTIQSGKAFGLLVGLLATALMPVQKVTFADTTVLYAAFAIVLLTAEKHESSISILKEAKQHLNNTILYRCLGNNYKALGKINEAEQAYLQAWHMAPARFYPLYLLAKLYDETGQTENAVAMANRVMEKEVKIESTAIKEIQEEMRTIIEKNEAEMLNESKIQTYKNLNPIYKGTKEGANRSVVLTCGFKLQKW